VKRADDGKMGEFQWMNAPAAAEKRLSLVLNARGQEKDLRDFSPKNARNALGRESALVLWRHRHHSSSATTRKLGRDQDVIASQLQPRSNAWTASSAPSVVMVMV
jgi:hypothetical protein